MRKLVLTLCGLAVLVATPAFAADSDLCVRRNDIRNWASPAPRQLILENYAHHKVLLKMSGSCQGFGPYDSFQITGPLESNASCVVAGDDVITHWAGEPGHCTIFSIEPYSGELHTTTMTH